MGISDVQLAAAGRVRRRRPARRCRGVALALLLAGGDVDSSLIDPPARQYERARLLGRPDLSSALGTDPSANRRLYEAVIGTDDRLPSRFLADGGAAARPVGRIVVATPEGETRFGTGSLLSPHLVLTNHHVLDSPAIASFASIEFGYFVASDGPIANAQRFDLLPQELYLASSELDFALVAVEPTNGQAETSHYGSVGLVSESGKALIGEPVNIVQHAGGGPQTVSIRANVVVDVFDEWIHYTSDTEAGASGAPVFNDSWQLVAIHHATVPVNTDDGREVMVNEGVRISAIVDRLQQS